MGWWSQIIVMHAHAIFGLNFALSIPKHPKSLDILGYLGDRNLEPCLWKLYYALYWVTFQASPDFRWWNRMRHEFPLLKWIRLVSQDAHQVKATQNGIRQIHVLREGPGRFFWNNGGFNDFNGTMRSSVDTLLLFNSLPWKITIFNRQTIFSPTTQPPPS